MRNTLQLNYRMTLLLIVSVLLSLEGLSQSDSIRIQRSQAIECYTEDEVFILYDFYVSSLYPDSIIQAGRAAFLSCNNHAAQQDSTIAYQVAQIKAMEAIWLITEEQSQTKDEQINLQQAVIEQKNKEKWIWGGAGTLIGILLGAILTN